MIWSHRGRRENTKLTSPYRPTSGTRRTEAACDESLENRGGSSEMATDRTRLGSSIRQGERVSSNETQAEVRRLLSPTEAAAYLGLGSRFAIYRLVSSGRLPAVRLANKVRLDLQDLDAAIELGKHGASRPEVLRSSRSTRPREVPRQLAPLRRRKKSVTSPVTAALANR